MAKAANHVLAAPLRYASVIVALVLMVGSGIVYRASAQRFGRDTQGVALPPGTLAKFPMTLGQWRGEDVPMSEALIEATATDDLINRSYRDGPRQVSFFIAYGIRLRDLAPHRPEVCYPGAGWTWRSTETVDVALPDGSFLPCQIHEFQRAGLQADSITVLNYYIVDGDYCPDVSLLRSRQARLDEEKATYAAQVQVTSSGGFRAGSAEKAVRAFAALSSKPIMTLLTEAVAEATAGNGGA